MGRSKIFPRATPVLRKKFGQMSKLFGLWENSKLKDPVPIRMNPQPVLRDGIPDFLSQIRGVRTKFVTRRQTVLNRHFTEIVSDVLAMNFKSELDDVGIRITSIETKAWNKGVRIYYTREGPYCEDVHRRLLRMEDPIRYKISERRLIARAPKVNFVFDSSIQFDKSLDEAIARISLNDDVGNPCQSLTRMDINQVTSTKNTTAQEQKMFSRRFSAPSDMDNTILGLNYPELYDEVALKLGRGRADSSKMAANLSYPTISKPLFRDPPESNVEDPIERIKSMKKFLVSQKLKAENKSRLRRKEELLSLNRYKWTTAEESDREEDSCDQAKS